MLDDMRFLIVLGVVFPTLLYTVWSVVELQHLPGFLDTFPEAAAIVGSASAGADRVGADEEEGGPFEVVLMANMAYVPEELEVEAGTTVRWVNDDAFDHAVASGTPDTPDPERAFEGSGDFGPGETFELTFDEPRTYEIHCSTTGHYQAGMVMTVHVTEEAP
ncbi:MAG: plastocyanin/azurin family copper-binding protein [Trueperaceae bacterium]